MTVAWPPAGSPATFGGATPETRSVSGALRAADAGAVIATDAAAKAPGAAPSAASPASVIVHRVLRAALSAMIRHPIHTAVARRLHRSPWRAALGSGWEFTRTPRVSI